MSDKKKPNFQGPPTQQGALEQYKPQGFYAPYGDIQWGNDGYKVNIPEGIYNSPAVTQQYNDIRLRLLKDFGLTGDARSAQLDQYGQAFMDKSLEYSAPRLKALTFGRGQAGSRMAADSYADLVNKAATDSVLSREQLRNLDEQLKMQQLSAAEGGITNDLNRQIAMIDQLMAGGAMSSKEAQQALNNAYAEVQARNELEADRFQRSKQAPGWLAAISPFNPVAGAAATIRYDNPQYLQGSLNNMTRLASGMMGMGGGMSMGGSMPMAATPSPFQYQPGWTVPGYGGYGAYGPGTSSNVMLPKTAF